MIRKALDTRASDIHIEPFENRLIVRYRIDGVMHEVESPPRRLSAAVISRVKIMANLDIAERRLPQDGRIKLRIQGKEIDLRVSTVPTMHGESVVMRILDKGGVPLNFESLGFEPDLLAKFTDLLVRPHGILLVTGPTGSGKTTTLYTALSMLNQPDVKILTVEDPVEYQMEGINQIQVKPQIDLTFANALRSIVRQDPDVIMIGEIRDLETAQITSSRQPSSASRRSVWCGHSAHTAASRIRPCRKSWRRPASDALPNPVSRSFCTSRSAAMNVATRALSAASPSSKSCRCRTASVAW